MEYHNNPERYRIMRMKKDLAIYSRGIILYELIEVRKYENRRFAISATCCGERCSCWFGNSKKDALIIYEKIVKGRVTPCTLNDIADDYLRRDKN